MFIRSEFMFISPSDILRSYVSRMIMPSMIIPQFSSFVLAGTNCHMQAGGTPNSPFPTIAMTLVFQQKCLDPVHGNSPRNCT